MSRVVALVVGVICGGLLACAEPSRTPDSAAFQASPNAAGASAPRADVPGLCARAGDDAVRDLFCAARAPDIGSLFDLQSQLGLVFDPARLGPADEPPIVESFQSFPELALVLINSSTALPGRFISTINPRAILLGRNATMAFNRGVQQVELLSRDRHDGSLNFYLVRFEQACNRSAQGCLPGDLYTPRVERDWTAVRIDDDEDLKNTASDCRQCHQRAGQQPTFLMRELKGPWTHFFSPEGEQPPGLPEPTGIDILRAYQRAKGDEPYGNIPWEAIRATVGFTLESVVEVPQPLVFNGNDILNERWPWTEAEGFAPAPQRSPTWVRAYEAFKRGEHLAMPHFDPMPTDPVKLDRLTQLYRAFRDGALAAEELPDLGDIYPDDPRVRAEIGFQTEPGASPAEALVQACGPCHNDVLDQSISRARFSIDLSRLDRAELELAIERIQLPSADPAHMPPQEFRQLDPAAVQPLIDYLRNPTRPAQDDALLRNAAQLGMAIEVSGRAGTFR